MKPTEGITPREEGETKGQATRRRIFEAAEKVFTRHPYRAASVRMIAAEGGFEHPLIQYHFRTKGRLFEEYVQGLNEQMLHAVLDMLPGLERLPPEKGLETFVDRILDYGFDNPSYMSVMMLNVGGLDFLKDSLPGLDNMRQAMDQMVRIFQTVYQPKAPAREIAMWLFAFALVMGNYLGARQFHARVEDLDPGSLAYRQWIKETLLFVFGPPLRELISGDRTVIPEIPPDFPIKKDGRARQGKAKARMRKGEATRRKILDAALHVFTHNPYDGASIRMIGKQGGFDFTLIHHYYPTKKELFEAVAVELMEQSLLADDVIMEGLEEMPLNQALAEAVERALSHSFANPAPEMVLMQNMAQLDRLQDIPGFEIIRLYHAEVMRMLKERFFPHAVESQLRMWQHSMVAVTYSCVGAPAYPARIMGMDPGGGEYRAWIRDTLVFLLYPTLKELLFPGESGTP